MRIAVLMSSYNGSAYIREQIDSVLEQQLSCTLELWVRDDGSQDATREILQEYADAGKLQWYTGENLKPAKSFMDLLKHCPGYDYYAFCDQDDYWKPDKVATALSFLEDTKGPAMYFSNARMVDAGLNDLGRDVYRKKPHTDFFSLVCNGGILGCTMVLNAELARLMQEAPMPEHIIMHDAYAAVVCAMWNGTIHYDPQSHMEYRQHGNNVVGSNWTKVGALKDRIGIITTRAKVSIAAQAASLLQCYRGIKNPDKENFLRQVASYRKSIFSAVKLALSTRPRYNSKNMAITVRLALLLRNR